LAGQVRRGDVHLGVGSSHFVRGGYAALGPGHGDRASGRLRQIHRPRGSVDQFDIGTAGDQSIDPNILEDVVASR
jgi:hypothetical protein